MFIVTKKVAEKFPIGIDFTSKLDNGETISSCTIESSYTDGIDLTTQQINGNQVTVWIQNGTPNVPYFITFTATTSQNKIWVARIRVNVMP